jgi:hypothetical protein
MVMKIKLFGFGLIPAIAVTFCMSALDNAQASGHGPSPDGSGEISQDAQPRDISTNSGSVSLRDVSTPATNAITSRMSAAGALCEKLESAYYVDCLGERLASLSEELSTQGDYRKARKIIAVASARLRNLAALNRDSLKQRIRVRTPGSATGKRTKRITPIKPATAASVKKQAELIIANAQLKLLRSANNSQRRKSHYQQIAAALGSESKVLLRSL